MAVFLSVTRVIHVIGAVIWAGVTLTNYIWLLPAVKASGPAGGTVMGRIAGGSLPRVLTVVPILTVLAGLALYWVYSGHFNAAYILSWKGAALTIGALAGLAAFAEGAFVTGPTAGKISKLSAEMQAASGPPKPEQVQQMQALQARLDRATARAAVLLVVALAGMSLGAS